MAATQKDPVLVVVQLSGGNDYLNTVVPYNNGLYRDNRKAVGIGDNQILRLDDEYGMPSFLAPMKQFWDDGKLAVMHGVGYLDSPRSHFRSMDIWHTCEPDKVGTEGWLGRVIREIDPNKENVVTAVSFGPCLFRALSVPGGPGACVAGPLGTRVFYCDHGSFDTHAGQGPLHAGLWTAATKGLEAFMADLRAHDRADNVIILIFSEFGRRVRDNGSGTDHGAAGVTFVLGEKVKGGHYGNMPSLEAGKLVQGDLNPNMDFRGIYSTILDRWLHLDPVPIVNGKYEQPGFLN